MLVICLQSQNVPSCKEINTPSDVHQRQPQFTPQLHPGQLYHPGVHPGPHPGSYPGPSFTLPGPQPDPNLIHLKHTTEMIGRQAAEITELKTTAEKLEAKYQREVERLKDKLEETETRSREDVRRRKDEVSHQNQLHQRQVNTLRSVFLLLLILINFFRFIYKQTCSFIPKQDIRHYCYAIDQ